MIPALLDRASLEGHLLEMAQERSNRSIPAPKWARSICNSDGFRRSLAGFIYNKIEDGAFLFRRKAKRLILRKSWAPGIPEHFPAQDYDDLSDDEKQDCRIAFRLSLPDMLLHSIVGGFLTEKCEPRLSEHADAYRRNRGQPAAVRRVRELQANRDKWVVKLDVASFNETVDHRIMRNRLSRSVYGILDDQERGIVEGTMSALFRLSRQATGRCGKGLVVGSGLTPALTNIYLTPLDRYIEGEDIPFVRYGDDLVAFCSTKRQAQHLLRELKKRLARLGQSVSKSSAFNVGRCWRRGMKLRFGTQDDAETTIRAEERSNKKKTDIFRPGESFDFIGFDFAGERVFIRQETLGKIKGRIEQYTQRSKERIRKALNTGDGSWGILYEDESGEELAVASVRYVRHAIQRINSMMGFRSRDLGQAKGKYVFTPGYGFAWNTLRCVNHEDVQEQFRILDAYAHRRLQYLSGGPRAIGSGQIDDPRFDFPLRDGRVDLRAMGWETLKDASNRIADRP
jgi:hypothetical protein